MTILDFTGRTIGKGGKAGLATFLHIFVADWDTEENAPIMFAEPIYHSRDLASNLPDKFWEDELAEPSERNEDDDRNYGIPSWKYGLSNYYAIWHNTAGPNLQEVSRAKSHMEGSMLLRKQYIQDDTLTANGYQFLGQLPVTRRKLIHFARKKITSTKKPQWLKNEGFRYIPRYIRMVEQTNWTEIPTEPYTSPRLPVRRR